MNSKTILVRFKLRHWVLTTSQKNPEISVESGKWNISFPENPFGTCRLSPEIVLLFHSERKRAPKFPYHLLNFPVSSLSLTITGNWIANGKHHFIRLVCWFWKNPYRYRQFNGRPNRFILTNGKHPLIHNWKTQYYRAYIQQWQRRCHVQHLVEMNLHLLKNLKTNMTAQ